MDSCKGPDSHREVVRITFRPALLHALRPSEAGGRDQAANLTVGNAGLCKPGPVIFRWHARCCRPFQPRGPDAVGIP